MAKTQFLYGKDPKMRTLFRAGPGRDNRSAPLDGAALPTTWNSADRWRCETIASETAGRAWYLSCLDGICASNGALAARATPALATPCEFIFWRAPRPHRFRPRQFFLLKRSRQGGADGKRLLGMCSRQETAALLGGRYGFSLWHCYKIYDSALEDLKNGFHCRTALGRSSMADERAQIDRFGSHRRTKIERDGRCFFLGLRGRVHKHPTNRF